MSMNRVGSVTLVVVLCFTLAFVVTFATDIQDDVDALNSLKAIWQNVPPSWNGFGDPCTNRWEGIECIDSRVVSISLSSMGLKGTLSGDIQGLSELQTLDLSYNKGMSGPLPEAIGKLSKLTHLILIGCSFSGKLPDSIGSLSELTTLSLNSNNFIGQIPNSFGNLSKLYWLDLANNMLTGSIPVSNGTTPGLDLLVNTKHFHFGKNQLSGPIPAQLFNENMKLIHLLLDNNMLIGSIPKTLGLVNTLEVLRLDWNLLSGTVPSNINNLTGVVDLYLSNNRLTGLMPDLSSMSSLNYLDMSNISFDPANIPSWFSALTSLTTLKMEGTHLQGTIPIALFSLSQLQTLELRRNNLNGTLDMGIEGSTQLELVDLQNNKITAYTRRAPDKSIDLILADNPSCEEDYEESYCSPPQTDTPYTPPPNCIPIICNSNEKLSPNCKCSYPYVGTLFFRSTKFSNLKNHTYYTALEQKLITSLKDFQISVDSASLSNIIRDTKNYLEITLEIFPLDNDRFNRREIYSMGFVLSNQTFKPPPSFYGPYYFIANEYTTFADEPEFGPKGSKKLALATIIGIVMGCSAVLMILFCVCVIVCCRKNSKKSAARTEQPAKPSGLASSASWMSGSNTSNLKMKASKSFSFEEIKSVTNNFSEANQIGSGSYGKVYRGTHTNGQLIAVKRAERGSGKGGLEFQTEVELLSRVHHRNLVSLFGICSENDELILVYEYVPNGALNESLSGKSGIRLDWRRRIKIALGAARGLAYLHELADPPIIHRDIKSNNILLDENLDAKVSDFGLSRSLFDVGEGHVVTDVKGTMGYLDPEYYMTQKLTEKSDVYGFGVLMLEMVTGRPPIDAGKYILKQVNNNLDRSQDLYGLHEFVDPIIISETKLKGFEKYVDLALSCVEESGANRPSMGEVVKQLEDILEMAGLNPYSDSATSSATFDRGNLQHLYGDESLYSQSGARPR